ncbi:hypothetical protein [Candidatus Magnetomonas plexicatena]|uniref:hypothetical protein n=1 Tax=Candidatus Magnetomonas plexicatena TaxID=2552947 RepID=UPI001C786461|nr:hypothetical protein E2O03_012935 [Nitrospirales bacterium LBB_01]
MNEHFIKDLMALYSNPIFKGAFTDYLVRMQQDGMESARKYWMGSSDKSALFGGGADIFEKMVDFYSGLGFISRKKYDEVVEENDKLKKENAFLRDVLQKMNLKVFEEGSRNFQETWKAALDKQLSVSTELAKSFFEILKDTK